MGTCKITYNGNEISSFDEAAPMSVTYNSSTIATLNDGDIKTLGCSGKVMESDVVIGSKTLNCSGKLMEGDIVVELVGAESSGNETWYFNETIDSDSESFTVNFTSNETSFIGLEYHNERFSRYLKYLIADGSSIPPFLMSQWMDQSYRTIILEEPATGNLLTFLEANATKL